MALCNPLQSCILCYMPSFLILSMVGLELDCLLRAFFWEGREGSQIHHLVRLSFRSQAQVNEGFGIEALKPIRLALISICGWRFIQEPCSF